MNLTQRTNKQEERTAKNVAVLLGKGVQNILLADRHLAIVSLEDSLASKEKEKKDD